MLKSLYRYFKYGRFSLSNSDIVLRENTKLFLENKLMFIHIPKAAGVSLFHAFYGKDSLGHVSFSNFESFIAPEKMDELFKFTFVRNPYERIYSEYSYLKAGGRNNKSDQEISFILEKFDNFSEFLLELKDNDVFQNIEHFRPQSYWLLNKEDKLNLEYIGKIETIEYDLNIICKMNNLPKIELNHLNKSNKKILNIEKVYCNETKKIINELYNDDFELFDYKKH